MKPSAEGKYPGVIVIHENRGLNPHIKDVARRMAAEGFAALAPDYLHAWAVRLRMPTRPAT